MGIVHGNSARLWKAAGRFFLDSGQGSGDSSACPHPDPL